jgi:hypothetical protein
MADLDQFLREAYALVPKLPEPRIEYRVYFDDRGALLFYSMDDLPGNYVVVDREFFAGSPTNVRLRDGKLVVITSPVSSKLVPATSGISCDARDITVISEHTPCQKWTKRDYDRDC